MAENVNGTPNGDSRPRQDSTTMPGQYPSQLPFGIAVPSGTGAPGGGGSPDKSSDPTIQTLPGSVFGSPNPMTTGSPGSAGSTPSTTTGASYTDPFAYLGGCGKGEMTGGSIDTEANANKTGHTGPFDVANPLSTGVGEGQPLIGGRGGKNRGR